VEVSAEGEAGLDVDEHDVHVGELRVVRGDHEPAVADDRGHDQVRIVECGSKGMRQGVTQFATFMDAAGRLRSDVTGNAAGETELCKQLLHTKFVFSDVRVHLGVRAFKVGVGDQRWSAVTRSGNEEHIQVMRCDDPIEMHVNEVQSW
jgi:hypothetical protein